MGVCTSKSNNIPTKLANNIMKETFSSNPSVHINCIDNDNNNQNGKNKENLSEPINIIERNNLNKNNELLVSENLKNDNIIASLELSKNKNKSSEFNISPSKSIKSKPKLKEERESNLFSPDLKGEKENLEQFFVILSRTNSQNDENKKKELNYLDFKSNLQKSINLDFHPNNLLDLENKNSSEYKINESQAEKINFFSPKEENKVLNDFFDKNFENLKELQISQNLLENTKTNDNNDKFPKIEINKIYNEDSEKSKDLILESMIKDLRMDINSSLEPRNNLTSSQRSSREQYPLFTKSNFLKNMKEGSEVNQTASFQKKIIRSSFSGQKVKNSMFHEKNEKNEKNEENEKAFEKIEEKIQENEKIEKILEKNEKNNVFNKNQVHIKFLPPKMLENSLFSLDLKLTTEPDEMPQNQSNLLSSALSIDNMIVENSNNFKKTNNFKKNDEVIVMQKLNENNQIVKDFSSLFIQEENQEIEEFSDISDEKSQFTNRIDIMNRNFNSNINNKKEKLISFAKKSLDKKNSLFEKISENSENDEYSLPFFQEEIKKENLNSDFLIGKGKLREESEKNEDSKNIVKFNYQKTISKGKNSIETDGVFIFQNN